MRRSLPILALSLCLPLGAADPHMTADDRAKVIRLLQDSQKEFLSSVEGLTDAQWNYHEGPGRWSVGETAEHILLSEGMLFAGVERALASAPNPDWETKTAKKTEFLERALVDRSHKAQAPEAIKPRGLTRTEIIERYKEARGKTLKFAAETQIALKEQTAEHPFPVFGTLNAYQWLIYIPLHNMRHNQQIAEVQASAGYPK